MVTAELAAALPVLVLVLGVVLSAIAVAEVRVRAQDAAREAVRAAARGDPASARALTTRSVPGARLSLSISGEEVTAVVVTQVRPLGGWLPSITVRERAAAAVEPRAGSP